MRLFVRLAVSVGLLVFLFRQTDWPTLTQALADARVTGVFGAIVAVTLSRLLMPAKWLLLLRAKHIVPGYREAVGIYYAANFLGQVLPATVGTDLVRLHYVTVGGQSRSVVGASIIVERLIGVIGLAVFAVAGIFVLASRYAASGVDAAQWLTLFVVLTLAAGAVLLGVRSEAVQGLARSRLGPQSAGHQPGRVRSGLLRVVEACGEYVRMPRTLLAFFLLTLLEGGIQILARYLVVAAFVPEVTALYVIAFAPVVILLHRLPVSLAGWGVYQAGFVYFLSRAGVPPGVGLAIGIVDHLVLLVTVLPGAFTYLRMPALRAGKVR